MSKSRVHHVASLLTRAALALVALAPAMLVASCTTDSSLTKDLVGTWTWKPREQLPKDQVKEAGFVTPDLESVRFDADGSFVHVETLPGYDTQVGATTVHVPDEWRECHGSWQVEKGELRLDESETDMWVARHRPTGWFPDTTSKGGCGMFSYKIVDHQRNRLQLQAIDSLDHDRTFERTSTMPERPVL